MRVKRFSIYHHVSLPILFFIPLFWIVGDVWWENVTVLPSSPLCLGVEVKFRGSILYQGMLFSALEMSWGNLGDLLPCILSVRMFYTVKIISCCLWMLICKSTKQTFNLVFFFCFASLFAYFFIQVVSKYYTLMKK